MTSISAVYSSATLVFVFNPHLRPLACCGTCHEREGEGDIFEMAATLGASDDGRKSLRVATWNIAAVNNNPFEYFVTHDDPAYNKLMVGGEVCNQPHPTPRPLRSPHTTHSPGRVTVTVAHDEAL